MQLPLELVYFVSPLAPTIPEVTVCQRDTLVLLKLSSPNSSAVLDSSSLRYGVKDGGSLYKEILLEVTKDNVIVLDGLRQKTAYVLQLSVSNTAGTSNFTEWIEFNTTSKGIYHDISTIKLYIICLYICA